MVWADGDQLKMTFVDLNPKPSNAPTANFYVTAPQTRTTAANSGVLTLFDTGGVFIATVQPRHVDR
jgi:hypothetical protein